MTALLFKLFPVAWPFFKEMVLGLKDHPHSFNRRKQKPNPLSKIVLVLSIAVVILGDMTLTQHKEIEQLKAKITDLKNPESMMQLKMDHYLCKKDLDDIADKFKAATESLRDAEVSCESRVQRAKNELEFAKERPPVLLRETARDRAIRAMDDLRKQEQEQ